MNPGSDLKSSQQSSISKLTRVTFLIVASLNLVAFQCGVGGSQPGSAPNTSDRGWHILERLRLPPNNPHGVDRRSEWITVVENGPGFGSMINSGWTVVSGTRLYPALKDAQVEADLLRMDRSGQQFSAACDRRWYVWTPNGVPGGPAGGAYCSKDTQTGATSNAGPMSCEECYENISSGVRRGGHDCRCLDILSVPGRTACFFGGRWVVGDGGGTIVIPSLPPTFIDPPTGAPSGVSSPAPSNTQSPGVTNTPRQSETPAPANVAGTWDFVCCGGKYTAKITLNQAGSKITGRVDSSSNNTLGEITGTVQGSSVTFTRNWSTWSQVYNLQLSPDGKTMTGTYGGNVDRSAGVEVKMTRP